MTKSNRRRNPYISVNLIISGFNRELEVRLLEIAKENGGRSGDAGYDFTTGRRELSFDFRDLKTARAFANRANRFKAVEDINGSVWGL